MAQWRPGRPTAGVWLVTGSVFKGAPLQRVTAVAFSTGLGTVLTSHEIGFVVVQS